MSFLGRLSPTEIGNPILSVAYLPTPTRRLNVSRVLSRQTGVLVAVAILLAALIPLSQPYRHAAAWRVPPEHERFVDQALTGAAASLSTSLSLRSFEPLIRLRPFPGQTKLRAPATILQAISSTPIEYVLEQI